jgi:hypothetical protein
MGTRNTKLDDALGIDVDRLIKDAEDQVNELDDAQIQKYNERRNLIDKLKQDLTSARNMDNKSWSEALLKRSAETIVISQEIFAQQIEDDPASKNITALGELSNSLVNTVNAVQDIEREERKLKIAQEKNDLRSREIDMNFGDVVNAKSGVIAIGSGQDLIALLKNGIDPITLENKNAN